MKGAIIFITGLWILGVQGIGLDLWAAEDRLSLEALIEEAVAQNPEIRSSRYRMDASRASVSQAGALDDPMLMMGVDNVPIGDLSFDEFLPTSKVLGISQKVPFPGKLALKREAAAKAADSTAALYQDKIMEIVKRVKVAYYDLFYINRAIQINERNRALVEGLAETAATKYSVGTGLQQDVLKAQVELSKILSRLIVLKQAETTAKARINTLLNRRPESPLPDPGEVHRTPFDFTPEALQEMALGSSLSLKAMEQVVESNEATVALAKKQYYPDFNLALTYKNRETGETFKGDDWFSAFVTVNIPLYYKNKQDAAVVQATSELARAESKYLDVKNDVLFDVQALFEEIRKGAELLELYQAGFLPQAKQSLDAAISGYQVNKVDFLTLVDNQLTLLKFELGYYRTLTEYEKKLAELEAILDRRLF